MDPKQKSRRAARLLGAVSVAALAVGVLPVSPASAAIATTSACTSAIPQDGFTDTGPEDANAEADDVEDAVDCLVAYKVSSGKTATTYGTGDNVTRGQLATFVMAILDKVQGFARPANAPDKFPDDETSVHEKNINDAAALGIIGGRTNGTFGPDDPVTRAQMATFLIETLREAGITIPAGDNAFADDNGDIHEPNINSLEQLDIVDGEVGGGYNPGRNVTRGTMAFFLTRTLEVLVDGGKVATFAPTGQFQTLTVTPAEPATLTLANEGDAATRDTDNRTFTASGLANGTVYRITLVNTTARCATAGGGVGFLAGTDVNSSSGFSAQIGADIVDITSVNSAAPVFAPGDTESRTTTTQPVNGSITVTIDGTGLGTVVPVLYLNGGPGGTATTGGTSPRLEVQATAVDQCAAPIETFGLGGTTTYSARAAASGENPNGAITGVDKANDTFVTGAGDPARAYKYDANDQFFVDAVSVGLAAFEAALSTGDTITGVYTADPGGVSTFNLTDANPPAPTSVEAEKGATAATINDITVTVVIPAGDVDSLVIQRAPVTGGTDEANDGTVGTFATVASPATTADADLTTAGFQFVDNDVAPGSYRYRAALVNDGDQGAFTTDDANETSTAPVAADTTAPTITDVRAQDGGGGLAGVATNGDVIQFVFSEAMNVTTDDPGQSFRVTDADGTTADVVCGTDGTVCTLQGAGTFNGTARATNQVLRVNVGTLTAIAPGTSPGLQYPLTISTVSTGFDDVAGNQLDVAGSPDKSIDVAAITPAPTADATPPNIISSAASQGGNTVTLTYTEPVVCESSAAAAGAFGYTDGDNADTPPTSVVCNGSTTVVLTFAPNVVQLADGAANVNYTDEAAGPDVNDVRDSSGNSANSPDNNVPNVAA